MRDDWLQWVSGAPDELTRLNQPPFGDRALVLRETGELIGQVGLVPAFGPLTTLPGLGDNADAATAQRNTSELGSFWAYTRTTGVKATQPRRAAP